MIGWPIPYLVAGPGVSRVGKRAFGALTRADMEADEAFPFTVFQPASLLKPLEPGKRQPTSRYDAVATLKSLGEFKEYATLLNEAGYFVPRNWTWGMSIRDRAQGHVPFRA